MSHAEGWVIKAKIVRSHKFNLLNGDHFTQKVYCLLLAVKDSYGMLPADPYSLKAALGPLDDTKKPQAYATAIKKLRGVGLVYLWDHQGSPWLYVLGHDEENQITRRAKDPVVPRPDLDAMWAETNEVMTKSGLSQDFVSHPPARAGIGSGSGKGNRKGDRSPLSLLLEEKIPEQLAQDFLELRRNKRAPLTKTALDGIKREAGKARMSLREAIEMCCLRGWQGFKASWIDEKDRPRRAAPPPPKIDHKTQWADGARVYSRDDMEAMSAQLARNLDEGRTVDPATTNRVNRCMHERPQWDWA